MPMSTRHPRLDAVLRTGQVTISAEAAQLIYDYVNRKSHFTHGASSAPGAPRDLESKLNGFAESCKRNNARRWTESTKVSDWFRIRGHEARDPKNRTNEHCRRYIQKLVTPLNVAPRTHPTPEEVFNDPEWDYLYTELLFHFW